MSLEEVDQEDDEEDRLFRVQYTIDTVYASYAAAEIRVRQYTQLLHLGR